MNSTLPHTAKEARESSAVRILLVEDERLVALSLTGQLEKLGHQVVGQAAAARAAIEKAGALRPDLVIMDIHLEGELDGVDAAAEIRRQFQIPVIYLTAYSNPEILDRAKLTEPVGYILKPYEERDLHVVVEMAIYRHRAECERLAQRDAETAQQDQLSLQSRQRIARDRLSVLSQREAEVMQLIVAGKTLKQIAAQLGIAFQTAAKHRGKVLEKLGLANDVELARCAWKDEKGSD